MTLSEIEFVSRTRNVETRCVCRAYNAAKCDCGRGTDGLQRCPDPLDSFKGAASRRGGGEEREGRGKEGGEGKGRRGTRREGKGREGEVEHILLTHQFY